MFDLDITDNSSQIISIDVSGLVNGDLSAGQSVCGINLQFRHDYIGDLTIELVSPAGQSIKLIGDVTDMVNPTNLATWDIGFIPCGQTAIPDAGFQSVWSNDQMWEVFGNYSGTYHPHSGCFSDFNTGSANGEWRLIIDDNAAPATGIFVSAEILFCDMNGLNCSVCPADAGNFVQAAVDVCEGDPLPTNSFTLNYPNGQPDPDTANLTYLLSNGTQPIGITDDPEGFTWQAGLYSVCALSYLKSDSAGLFGVIDTMTLDEVHDAFDNNNITFCADLTEQCLEINIRGLPDTTMLNETICSGQAFVIAGQSFDQPGVYDINLTSLSGCDSVVRLDLSVREVYARIVQSDTLSCSRTTVTLSAASSTVPGTAAYQWAAVAGGITGPTNTSSVQITAPGIYSVTVTSLPSGCRDIRSWDVITDDSQPAIFMDDEVIDCNNPTVTLDPIVFPADVTYSWNGPGGFTSNVRNPSVSEGGEYWLVVTDPDGCSATQSVSVSVDTVIAQDASIRLFKYCEALRTVLVGRPATIEEFSWSGPNGFTSDQRIIDAPTSGLYTLVATYANGCSQTVSIMADTDYDIPEININVSLDSLECGESSILTASSPDNISEYNWSSEFLNADDTSSITVTAPGVYNVLAIGVNGCESQDQVTIFPGQSLPEVVPFPDTITCEKDTAFIGVVAAASVIEYRWTGPAVLDSFSDFIRVTEPGLYQVQMTDITGCVFFGAVDVVNSTTAPAISLFSDTLTCANSQASIWFESNIPIIDFFWTTGGVQIGTDSVLNVTEPGTYTLNAIGINGCPGSRSIFIPFDTLQPVVYIEPQRFGCLDSVQLSLVPIDSVVSYVWSGPSGFVSTDEDPFIYGPGSYTVNATAPNGCTTTRSIMVREATDPPEVAVSTELLDCIDSIAIFTASSPDTAATFAWFDPLSQMISDSGQAILDEPGDYELVVVGFNNCVTTDTLQLAPPVTPAIFANEDTINCRDEEVDLFAMSDSSMMTFAWFDSEGAPLGAGEDLRVGAPGVYTLTGTWSNGCTSDTTVRVYIDTMRPTAVAMTDESVKCEIREISLSGSASIGDSLSHGWRALSGSVLLGDDRDTAFVQGPGVFILTVEELINHCIDTDTLVVEEMPNTLSSVLLTIKPECQGNQAGSITFDTVFTADSPLEYSIGLNGGSTSPVFDSLVKGEYRLSVIDSFGCRLDTVVFVTETSSETTADLGPDQEILVGGMAQLTATLDVDSSALGGIFWEPALTCDSCLSNTVMPLVTTDYVIYVRDPFGCLAMDEVRVIVVERGQVYVPNVFSPNGDGNNDLLTITAHPGIDRIQEFSIYDRWGDLMFGVSNVDPKTETIAWDGMFAGQELNPGVFSYVMKLRLITGREEIKTGDITLLR